MKSLKASLLFLVDNISKKRYSNFKKILENDESHLLEEILNKDFQTDIEAAREVFKVKSNSIKYQKTKNELQKKINEQILFIDPEINKHPKLLSTLMEQNLVESLINVYILLNKRDLNIILIEKNFAIAYKHFLHTSVISMCQKLISYYGIVEHKPKLLSYYNNIYLNTIKDYSIECKSDLFFQNINNQFGKTQTVNKIRISAEIEKYLDDLKPYEFKVRSQMFHLNYYGLQMIQYHINHDYNSVVLICDKMLNYLKTLPFTSVGPMKQTLKRKANHLIMLGRFDDASNALKEVIPLEIEGSATWVNCQYLFLLIFIYKKEYQNADQFVQMLNENKKYKNLKTIYRPLISLFNVYLYLFKLMHVIPNNLEEGQSEVKKYMKEHVNFTKDKIGMNIPVVIAQLIEAIVQRRDSEILDRIEALKKYSSRYITKNNSLRSNCFMNMLIEVVKHNYHLVAIERHTRKYYTKLIANPKISSEEAAEIELIPYEDLWAILLDFIKSRKKA
jgi:hypothetical protein